MYRSFYLTTVKKMKIIADVLSYHAIYVISKALDSLSSREPRTLNLSWLTSRHVSLPRPWLLAEIRILSCFQATNNIYSNHFSDYCNLALQTFGHADVWGHEVCDTTEFPSQRILLHLSVYSV